MMTKPMQTVCTMSESDPGGKGDWACVVYVYICLHGHILTRVVVRPGFTEKVKFEATP